MRMMREKPVLAVGVATAALAIVLLAIGSYLKTSGAASAAERPHRVLVMVGESLPPGTRLYAENEGGAGMVRVGQVLGLAQDSRVILEAPERTALPLVVDARNQDDL